MSNSKIYKIIYLEQDLESVTTLKRIIRSQSVKSDFVIDVTSINILSQAVSMVEAGECDLILLRNSPNLPSLTEVFAAIKARDINVVSIVNEGKIDASQILYADGAILVTSLFNPEVFYKQIIQVLFLRSLKTGYRSALDKNRELIERSSGLLSSTSNMIAYVKDGMFLFANNAFLEHFGFDHLETLQRTLFLDMVSSKDITKFKTLSKKVLVSAKEAPLSASFKHNATQEEISSELILKKSSYEGEVCLELFIEHETTPSVTKITSETDSLNNRQIFFNVLPSFAETSSWLICIVIEDYVALRKKYGVILLESYIEGVVEQLKEQLKDLHIVRYSDQSLLMLMPNSDMTSVDRIGTAITSTAKNFSYTIGDVSIESSYHFTYTSLGNSVKQIEMALKTIDKQANLLYTVAAATTPIVETKNTIDQMSFTETLSQHPDENETQQKIVVEIRDDEFAPLQKNINDRSLCINYLPIADFSQGDSDLYLMNYDLIGEDGKIFYWNKGFVRVAHNSTVKQLDELLLEYALTTLQNEQGKKIVVNLSMYYMLNPKNLVDFLKHKDPTGILHKQVVFGFSEEAFQQNMNRASEFFNELKKNKFSTCIYDVADAVETQISEADVDYVSLAANYVGRLSRGGSNVNQHNINALLSDLKGKNIQVLAEGVDSPSHMAMVWEYNIPLASGDMVGGAREQLDFDFSQIMM